MRQLTFAIAILLGGCAGSLSDAERHAEEAKNIPPVNYKADVVAFLRTYLNNPTNLRNAAMSQPELRELGPIPRYVACVRYDAKGSNGQYAGIKDSLVIFISGRLDSIVELGGSGGDAERRKPLREFCAAAEYERFPELERLTR
jgi:hypothetical protein